MSIVKSAAVAAGFLVLSGCDSIPGSYNGSYSGVVGGHAVQIEVGSSEVSVSLDGRRTTTSYSNFVSGFDDAVTAALNTQAGVYVMPVVTMSLEAPVSGPWITREVTTGIVSMGMSTDNNYSDLYLVLPSTQTTTPDVEIQENQFNAQIVYTKLDMHPSSPPQTIDIQIVPQCEVSAEHDSLIFGSAKILTFEPLPANAPVIETGTLNRDASAPVAKAKTNHCTGSTAIATTYSTGTCDSSGACRLDFPGQRIQSSGSCDDGETFSVYADVPSANFTSQCSTSGVLSGGVGTGLSAIQWQGSCSKSKLYSWSSEVGNVQYYSGTCQDGGTYFAQMPGVAFDVNIGCN